MGQQQLLLLVLGIVIVGLAVVAGISAFEENQEKSARDALINEGMRIATDVHAQQEKPGALGGGSVNDLTDVGYDGETYGTPWGNITYNSSNNQVELTTNSGATAKIDVPSDGTPTVNSSGSNGKIWTSGG